ncbi:DUF6520 family protein [Chryseobacterium salipaludis]|uniref:DUF6520 family protein n=1 Tax=Chryseobacterium TaxID=59732 RepID=UPI001FF29FE4|nr:MULTISPECIES: DUF6520 family protein [Chryseobacterium]MCJ8498616.1 DUF6520 family protein [Chryseobacterium salipaludis]MCX3297734.1 DUF6520 family protein [Planobacterium sp. JC490]
MKNFKKILLPALIALAGAGSAYATHPAENEGKALRPGYAFQNNHTPKCIPSGKMCDTDGIIVCTAVVGGVSQQLYDLNGTSCAVKLFERP